MRSIFATSVTLACISLVGAHAKATGAVIGIDLGTTYSCVGVFRGGRVEIIPNDQGNRITPSWVAFEAEERLIGDTAKQAFHKIPSQTVFDVKRLIGRRFEESDLRADMIHWPFKVVEHNGRLVVQVEYQGGPKFFTPQEISAMILGKMKETAEMYLGTTVTHAVITVPAYFNDAQRQATKDAGSIAGLNVLRIVNEPTAAAIAYGLDKQGEPESKLIVYDLGGGTFDVSLLKVNNGVFEVLATAGDAHLGGEDFDNRVIEYIVAKYERETSTNISNNKRAMSKLRREVEKAKRTLSSLSVARLEIESFEGGNDSSFLLTRAKFEELNLDLFKRTMLPVQRVLQDTGIKVQEIQDIVLVGGSTRIPKVQQLLQELFGGKSPRMGINPDEAVAYGAAIQGGILSGEASLENMVLIDVCPLTLGIETTGGVFNRLIPRNTPLPIQKSEIFSTATDNQRTVLIKVFQGDHSLTKKNILLGTFELSGIPPAARGVPQIEVVFEVDNDGIMKVSAYNRESGNSESIVIRTDKERLSEVEMDRMSKELAEFSAQDEARRIQNLKLNELQFFISDARSRLHGGPSNQHHALYERLGEEAHWAELIGRFASLKQLEERLVEIKEAVSSLENAAIGLENAAIGLENATVGLITGSADATTTLNPHDAGAQKTGVLLAASVDDVEEIVPQPKTTPIHEAIEELKGPVGRDSCPAGKGGPDGLTVRDEL